MKYLSLFSGIGSPESALENLGIKFELFGFSEIDKYAVKSYCAVHGVDESLNLGDITKIDVESLPLDIDLITHGSPCQDFSVAGNGKGGDLGSGTRSSLMWNTVAICEHCQPKFVIWENVKNVLSKKHRHNFDKYLEEMDRIGYNNFYQILNAKDYGVPQNRERIFVVSIRKDLNKDFEFPKGFDNGIRLKDILEDKVDEKYYINTEKAERLISEYKGNLAISHPIRPREFEGQGWKDNCPTLDTMQGGNRQPKLMYKVRQATKQGYAIAEEGDSINLEQPNSTTRRGRVGNKIANTLTCSCNQAVVNEYRIRKLTPLECYRLMGFDDEDFYKASALNSNSQLYKQAGNSICVNVLEEIFKNLF